MTNIIKTFIFFVAITLLNVSEAWGLPLSHYAANSALADGNWVKIRVSESGMQYISNSQLKEMGFSNPEKVNVYGYGGRLISDILNDSQVDDLPCLPIVRTDNGICFFGVNSISWKVNVASATSYKHNQNFYSNDSYYFLSDKEIETAPINSVKNPLFANGEEIDSFTERLLHEKELFAPSNTGRVLLGEDFRSNNKQTFSFNLTDQADDQVAIEICFGAQTTNRGSDLNFKANDQFLKKASISNSTSSYNLYSSSSTSATAKGINNRLDLEIDYKSSGVVQLARLDYITVNYERKLKLNNNQLYFYHNIESDTHPIFHISGCSSATQIWDITRPHAPIKIDYELSGDVARFSTEKTGLREYIAFNPGKMSLSPTFVERIGNQNLHAMPVPDMVIISPAEFISQAQRIASLHETVDSMKVYVFTPDLIYNEFSSGVQDFSAYRKMLKMWYDRSEEEERQLGYCILFGRPSYDNRMITEKVKSSRYPRIPTWQSENSSSELSSYCNDDFIGMLEDCDTKFDMSNAKHSVAVGRMPVKTLNEATNVVDKLIKYITEPDLGAWRNNVMLIADDEDHSTHLDQCQSVYQKLRSSGNGKDFIYERLYLDSYPLGTSSSGKSYPEAKKRMMKMFDEGVIFVDYIGHANPTSWSHEGLLNYTDILNFSNTNLPFMLTATCEFNRWDADEISGAELMFLNPTAGAIGFISAIRKVGMSENGRLNDYITQVVFQRDKDGLNKRIGDIYIDGRNLYLANHKGDTNKLRFTLMGDPAMRLPSPCYGICIDSIGNVDPNDITDSADYPVIPARGKVTIKGRITDPTGATATDFNGVAIPTLFDAERAIKTYGNGEDGTVRHYNDRKNKLFTGKVPVVNGEWEVTILMPSEIDNNYSPALLNVYAYSDDKREANGSTESLYVYGWNQDAEEDINGPEISLLALNSEDFEDGDKVNNSPILLAKFKDDSGINISTSGFGHKITAVIDGDKVFDNLSDFYEADLIDFTSGSITYPLSELEVGEHTLSFTVWDNANNSSTESITFNVVNSLKPTITDLHTNVNPASTDVTFFVNHDMPSSQTTIRIEVFDLAGRKVWTSDTFNGTNSLNTTAIKWNLCDMSGSRVPRSIYLYRAIVTSAHGEESSETKKLAVTGQ